MTESSPNSGDPRTGPADVSAPIEEAIDAIVYDVHPALAPRRTGRLPVGAEYPYSESYVAAECELPPPPMAPPPGPLALVLFWADRAAIGLSRASDQYFSAVARPPDFVVPKTFGMSAILGMMTVLAIVFGFLRWLDAYPVFYFFFAVEALSICLAQMLYGTAARLASIVTGALILPVFTIIAFLVSPAGGPDALAILCLAAGFVPFGALLGYLTGTCAAGTFLVMDYLESCLQGRRGWAVARRPHPCDVEAD
jgi:hypothetical protein